MELVLSRSKSRSGQETANTVKMWPMQYYCYLVVFSLFLSVNGGMMSEDVEENCKKSPTGSVNLILDVPDIEPKPLFPIVSSDGANANKYREALQTWRGTSQEEILKKIKDIAPNLEVRTFWIVNKISVLGCTCGTAPMISAIPGNFVVRLERMAKIPLVSTKLDTSFPKFDTSSFPKFDDSFPKFDTPFPQFNTSFPQFNTTFPKKDVPCNVSSNGLYKNLLEIKVKEAWKKGFNGTKVIVGNIDTGVNYLHESLKDNYGGLFLNGFDRTLTTGVPKDLNGHGTHTIGTVCGKSVDGKSFGVAPGSTWISCLACDSAATCFETPLLNCAEFIVCPWLGQRPKPPNSGDCTLGADIISNSWGSLSSFIGTLDPIGIIDVDFSEAVSVWREMKRIPIFAIGNSAQAPFHCFSTGDPGGYKDVIGVGATDCDGEKSFKVADFSSRGPNPFLLLKPDIVAPGISIASAGKNNITEVVVMSGTSMATPHVAGAAAILRSKNKNLTYDEIYKILTETADRPEVIPLQEPCTILGGQHPYPNNVYGYGRINMEAAIAHKLTV